MAIYGAGGFGREMAVMIAQINRHEPIYDLIGFFDDHKLPGELVDGLPVLGGINHLNARTGPLDICLAVAEPLVRANLVQQIVNPMVSFPALCHPAALFGDAVRNRIGRGSIVAAGVILTTGIAVGEFCIVNLSTTIGHDVTLEDFCTIMPACSISGNVRIGGGTLMGTGARIIQGITIGEQCLIGAGSVVTRSFGPHLKLLGVPARKRTRDVA